MPYGGTFRGRIRSRTPTPMPSYQIGSLVGGGGAPKTPQIPNVSYNPLGGGGGGSSGKIGWGTPQPAPRPPTQPTMPGLSSPMAPGGGTSTSMTMPSAQPHQTYQGPGGELGGLLSSVGGAGAGLLDPNSDYFRRLMEKMEAQMGRQTGARQQGAALRAARSGFGGGQSGELMAANRDIGVAGERAYGEAGANLLLEAPKIGGELASRAIGPMTDLERLGEQSSQFSSGQAEDARKFGVSTGVEQERMAAERSFQEAQLEQQRYMAEMDAYMRELSLSYS